MAANTEITSLSIATEIVWRDVTGNLVLFDERSGVYHTLNSAASFVWRGIARGLSIDAIIAEAVAPRPERGQEIADDIRSFVAAAIAQGLIIA